MRHKGFTWWEAVIVFAGVFILAAILFPIFAQSRDPRALPCQSVLKQIGIGFMSYVQDYDEVFPRVEMNNVNSSFKPFSKPYGWADALYPYLSTTRFFQCGSEHDYRGAEDATQLNFTDYWINSNLSNIKLEKIKEPAKTILSGDGNDGTDATNARYSIDALPQRWIADKSSPAYRHLEGANYLFADGHVKWFKPEDIKTTPASKGGSTFSIK